MYSDSKHLSFRTITIIVLSFFFCFFHSTGGKIGIAMASTSGSNNVLKSIAILPFENLTNTRNASIIVVDQIKADLKSKGWLLIVRDEVIDEYLFKRRIRYTGAITRLKAREMGKVLGVDAVMVGSVEMFGSAGGSPNTVSISARLVSTTDGSIMWADNMAYTGEDFRGLFGLGVIRNMTKLKEVVISELVESIADNFFIQDSVMSPFEIEKFVTYPAIGKVGDKIELRIKFLSISDDPREVSVMIDGKQLSLKKISEGVYSVFIDAPIIEGVHLVDVVAVDGESVPFTFDAAGKIIVDSTPPQINFSVENNIFSTLHKGKVILRPQMLSYDTITEWYVEVIDKNGDVIRSDSGFNNLPETLKWRGDTSTGGYAKDGEYDVKLVASDKAGNLGVVHQVVTIKNSPPKINVGVDIVDDTVLFSINKVENSKGDEIGLWSFVVAERSGRELKKFYGEGEIPNTLEYVFEDKSEINRIAFTLTASDIVGNELEIKKALPSLLKSKRPFAGLQDSDINRASVLSDF